MPHSRPKTAPAATSQYKKRPRNGALSRTNSNCKECKIILQKSEGEICDECRLTKLGWKKIPAVA